MFKTETSLLQAYKQDAKTIPVFGTNSIVAIAKLLCLLQKTAIGQTSQVVILPSHKQMKDLQTNLIFFGVLQPVYALPAFDVAPESGLYPNTKVIAKRLKWLDHAYKGEQGIYLTTIESSLQKTLPISQFTSCRMALRKGFQVPYDMDKVLSHMGYFATHTVEDLGHYCIRGGIIDVYSPSLDAPLRIELFGQSIESLRIFDPKTQRSIQTISKAEIIPCREVLVFKDNKNLATQNIRGLLEKANAFAQAGTLLKDIVAGTYFHGIDYLLASYYDHLNLPMDYFQKPFCLWKADPLEISRQTQSVLKDSSKQIIAGQPVTPSHLVKDLYANLSDIDKLQAKKCFEVSQFKPTDIKLLEDSTDEIDFKAQPVRKFLHGKGTSLQTALAKSKSWINEGYQIVISTHTMTQAQRLQSFLQTKEVSTDIKEDLTNWIWKLDTQPVSQDFVTSLDKRKPFIIPSPLSESLLFPDEKLILLREEDFFGKKTTTHRALESQSTLQRSHFSFAQLHVGNKIVHIDHGVGLYEGLKVMKVQDVDFEFLQIRYKNDHRLYVPIYKVGQIQKYSGPGPLDALGGNRWKQAAVKVRSHLKDIANDLLQIYAKRSEYSKEPLHICEASFKEFEAYFPYEETPDQVKAIADVLSDMNSQKPMDRLICGDVGFGKTEVAMRAAFHCVLNKKQCLILVPTTILCFQHNENFQNRFEKWPVTIKSLSRLTPRKDEKQILKDLKDNKIDILIGTHKLLGRSVKTSDLGLLIIDEEQRFGVAQKEKIRQLKVGVDTLALSATPIPRTLNMSLTGLRDLSLITTAPQDRLPSRTFVCQFEPEMIKKAILSEIQRGGQVFYVHNHVKSIYEEEKKLKALLPDVRIRVGHGQLSDHDLEKIMLDFFHQEFDVLLCTTIIESGIDIPKVNTMIVNRADKFGLSQLYQLRGRIGRSHLRAFCYLLLPESGLITPVAQERLKTLQECSDLGSGLQIAHYDLELRGAGHLLGEAQSGHIEAVGYDLYLELLEEAIASAKGSESHLQIEPDIHIPIPALIPDEYMPDIRVRLAFYRRLSKISNLKEVDGIEEDLQDQFGKPPESVLNLLGLMSIRFLCKQLGISDLKAGRKNLSLTFTEKTPLSGEKVVALAVEQKEKYQLSPDHRLIINLQDLTWPFIYKELLRLSESAVRGKA